MPMPTPADTGKTVLKPKLNKSKSCLVTKEEQKQPQHSEDMCQKKQCHFRILLPKDLFYKKGKESLCNVETNNKGCLLGAHIFLAVSTPTNMINNVLTFVDGLITV